MQDEQLKKIQSDVDNFNKALFNEPEPEPKTDPPSTDPPDVETDPPSTDAPTTEEPKDEPLTEPPKTEPPTTDAPDERDQIIEDLRKKLAEREAAPKTEAPKTEPPSTEAPLDEQDFLGDEDVYDIGQDKEQFNKLLNKVYKQAVKDTEKRFTIKPTAEPKPQISEVEIAEMAKARQEFYTENKDLEPYNEAVGAVFGRVAQENLGKPLEEVLRLTAVETRKLLNLKTPGDRVAPRLPKKKRAPGAHQPKPKPSSVESDIEKMNKAIGR